MRGRDAAGQCPGADSGGYVHTIHSTRFDPGRCSSQGGADARSQEARDGGEIRDHTHA